MTLPQTTLDRLVSEDRARHVAEILFPDEVPENRCLTPDNTDCRCWRCRERLDFSDRVAQVRAAIQATFPTPNPQSRKS